MFVPEVERTAEDEERSERQVLVLGLDGAGKSSMLQGLNGKGAHRGCRPTRGFNFMSVSTPACQFDFLEIGGGEDLRVYWTEYLRRTHVLVYVVDCSDRGRLPLAKDELHRLLRADARFPVVVLGNKQLRDALCLGAVSDERKVFLLAAQLGSDGLGAQGTLQAFKDLLLQLV
ncbi:hypothetical protein Z043_117271 [Scleropages formosus]|uniref:Uncharacterized protein n=1 Tax=Scleropages formosus TaxID=113540 RepID=A0A0P7UR24_SCLFO|nr:hypothetical protein Z043_117271 [Scleropages formosus]